MFEGSRKVETSFNDQTIKAHKCVFNVCSEEDLNEWRAYFSQHCPHDSFEINHFVDIFCSLAPKLFEKKAASKNPYKYVFDLVYEESEHFGYFSIKGKKLVKFLKKHENELEEFAIDFQEKRISFMLSLTPMQVILAEEATLDRLEIISLEDQEVLNNLTNELLYMFERVQQKVFVMQDFAEVYHLFSKYTFILMQYPDLQNIAEALTNLAEKFSPEKKRRISLNKTFIRMLRQLFDDLIAWKKALFANEALNEFEDKVLEDVSTIDNLIFEEEEFQKNFREVHEF